MIVKILHGRSFKGAAAYLLHGKNGEPLSSRVAWTVTRNLATSNPETAWRVMAAVAIDGPQRKKEAGIRNTGRKQKNVVKHLMLSWHPEERETLTREDMEAAIEGALAALNAQNQQALVISHNDKGHMHVHVLFNRSLENGTLLDDSNEWNNLSDWAREYQRQRDQDYCPQRELNAEARARGEHTKFRKTPRKLIEAAKLAGHVANDNDRRIALVEKHRELARQQAARSGRLKDRHKAQWDDLQAQYLARRRSAKEKARKGQEAARNQIIGTFRPEWQDLKRQELDERRQFERREKSTFGRLSNLFRNIDITRSAADGEKPSILTQLWRGISSAEHRKAMMAAQQAERRHELEARQRKAIRAAMLPVITTHRMESEIAIRDYHQGRADLNFSQAGERAKNKADWAQLISRRERDFVNLKDSLERVGHYNENADPMSFLERIAERAQGLRMHGPTPENDNDPEQEQD